MPAFIGRDVTIELILAKETRGKVNGAYPAPISPAVYIALGGTRGLSKGVEWDTVDATSRSSAGNVRESLVNYLSVDGSVDGVWLTEDAENINDTDDYVNNPTSGQPYAWIRITKPGDSGGTVTEEIYAILTSFSFEAPYDDVGTFSMDYMGQQAVIKTVVPA
jgi:predicted secreted protein